MHGNEYKLRDFVAHHANVNCVQIGPSSGQVIVSGGEDHMINLWRVDRPASLLTLNNGSSSVESVCFDPSEKVVVSGSKSGALKLYSLGANGRVKCKLQGHRSSCTAIDFHPYGEFVLSGSMDTNIKIWDIRNKSCIKTYKSHTDKVNCVQFSPDGKWFASGGDDGSVKIWDLTAGKILEEFNTHRGPVNAIRFHPNVFLLASASSDRTVKFWDLESFEHVGTTPTDTGKLKTMAFAQDNQDGRGRVICGSNDGVKTWEWEPCRCVSQFDIGFGNIGDIYIRTEEDASLGSEQSIICSFKKSTVSVWAVDANIDEGKEEESLDQHTVRIESKGKSDPYISISCKPKTGPNDVPRTKIRSPSIGDVGGSREQVQKPEQIRMNPRKLTHDAVHQKEQKCNESKIQQIETHAKKGNKIVTSAANDDCEDIVGNKIYHSNDHPSEFVSKQSTTPESKVDYYAVQSEKLSGIDQNESKENMHEKLNPKQILKTTHFSSVSNNTVQKIERIQCDNKADDQRGLVPAGHKSPLGLSFTQFMPKRKAAPLVQDAADLRKGTPEFRQEIAKQVTNGHEKFNLVLSARMVELKQVLSLWKIGNLESVVKFLDELGDVCVTVDFLKHANFALAGLDLNSCSLLLPLLRDVLDAPYETQIQVGLKTVEFLHGSFCDVIHTTLSSHHNGIDMAREERIEKCGKCATRFRSVRNQIERILQSKKASSIFDGTLTPMMKQAQDIKDKLDSMLNV